MRNFGKLGGLVRQNVAKWSLMKSGDCAAACRGPSFSLEGLANIQKKPDVISEKITGNFLSGIHTCNEALQIDLSQRLYRLHTQVQASGAALFSRIVGFSSSAGDEVIASRKESSVDDEAKRRIFNRSRQRGYLELDLLLGKWAEDNISHLDEKRLKDLVDLLEEENPDLWNWLTGQAEVPPELSTNSVFTAIRDQITVNLTTHSSPETRAQPGQPWVRGWDDNRKIGGPQSGNQ